MTKDKVMGVYRNDNGLWYYRFTMTVNGQKQEFRGAKDEFGNPLRTQKQAIQARDAARRAVHEERYQAQAPILRRTVKEVYEEYCEKGRTGRAYQTIRKQDSLWTNHLRERFGNMFVDAISVAVVNDYLADLYYNQGFSFRYVESFLKMFYLIFGQAYSRNYLAMDIYSKLCKNKDTKIHMPAMKDEDDLDIVAFSKEELATMDKYFKGTNAETAYLLGKFCGLRINECFGLKWSHVDFNSGTIYIDRQQQYQNGLVKLVPVKTRNGKRTVYMNAALREHLEKRYAQEQENRVKFAAVRKQKQRFIEDLDGQLIPSMELVNCLSDGTLQTVNSIKYPSREIKSKLGIKFKYHYLRHTFGTMMAELNTPQHLLCKIMGHGNIHVTQRYYLAVTPTGEELLKDKLNQI
ncbi:MAG: site-specific integrase [Clostridia bacterium]|nr:site-specific integrase [Clostridia bacterium]